MSLWCGLTLAGSEVPHSLSLVLPRRDGGGNQKGKSERIPGSR